MSTSYIETGSYTGNETARSIVVGWQPRLLYIGGTTRFNTKDEGMSGDDWLRKTTTLVYETTNGVTLTSTGFDLGTDSDINLNSAVFYWLAIR